MGPLGSGKPKKNVHFKRPNHEESLPMATKTEVVEETVVKMEEDDEGWDIEEEI